MIVPFSRLLRNAVTYVNNSTMATVNNIRLLCASYTLELSCLARKLKHFLVQIEIAIIAQGKCSDIKVLRSNKLDKKTCKRHNPTQFFHETKTKI